MLNSSILGSPRIENMKEKEFRVKKITRKDLLIGAIRGHMLRVLHKDKVTLPHLVEISSEKDEDGEEIVHVANCVYVDGFYIKCGDDRNLEEEHWNLERLSTEKVDALLTEVDIVDPTKSVFASRH